MIIASAPGNLFFFGEYAALFGKPSICAAVNIRTQVSLRPRNDKMVAVDSDAFGHTDAKINKGFSLESVDSKELKPVLGLIDDLVQRFNIKNGFDLKIESEIPPNSGMSSSTAVFCAILKALSAYANVDIKNEEYFDIIYPHQAKVHGGKASGMEIISSSVGGFNYLTKKLGKIHAESLDSGSFPVVIGNTRISAPTALSVKYHIPSMEKRFSNLMKKSFDELEKICIEAKKEIQNRNTLCVGELMNRNQKVLSDIGVSHPKLDDCISEAKKAGVYGAKLSGSGWGGICFALCDAKNKKEVARAIEKTGCEAMITDIGCEGVRLEK
ncbi:MAG: mevalonate kinase [Candidatus Aenigmarchaeota archaeon]|nr:mevalonate kinase [Candidatus Aenigmarchaeota archaeon]